MNVHVEFQAFQPSPMNFQKLKRTQMSNVNLNDQANKLHKWCEH